MRYSLRRLVILGGAGLVVILVAFYIRVRVLDRQRVARAVEEAERLQHIGKVEEAIEVLDDAVTVEPARFEAREALSHLYMMTDKPLNGIAVLQEGIKLFPKDPRAYLALGTAYVTAPAKDLKKAIFYLKKAIRLKPSDLYARNLLVRCLNWQGEREEARREVEAILKLDPSNVAARAAQRRLDRDAKRARPARADPSSK
jgi:cytochrome c-type biogenesis protein CcmH/NrfG